LLALLSSPSSVFAQDGGEEEIVLKEPTPAQLEMNGKAIEQVDKKDFAAAIDLFEASIRLGELNITYLNMGRTYQRMGQCVKAKETYRKARQTRFKVPAPAPEVVDKALNEYESELYKSCISGELVVNCDPEKADLYIDTKGPYTCPTREKPMLMKEGDYVLKVTYQGYEDTERVTSIKRVEIKEVDISLSKKVEEKDPVVVKEPVKDPNPNPNNGNTNNNGQPINIVINTGEQQEPPKPVPPKGRVIALASVGVAMLVGGMLWDTCVFNWSDGRAGTPGGPEFCQHTYDGEFTGLDVVPAVLYGVGAGLAIIPPLRRVSRKAKADQYAPPSEGSAPSASR